MLERDFQKKLIKDIKTRLPGSIVTKMPTSTKQGLPDILVLYQDKWATLECKRSPDAPVQPNQEYYVNKMNDMSFSRFINPANKEDILDELESAFRMRR